MDENVGQGFQVLKLSAVDPNVYNKLNIHMWSTSNAGMEQYTLDTSGPGEANVFSLSEKLIMTVTMMQIFENFFLV